MGKMTKVVAKKPAALDRAQGQVFKRPAAARACKVLTGAARAKARPTSGQSAVVHELKAGLQGGHQIMAMSIGADPKVADSRHPGWSVYYVLDKVSGVAREIKAISPMGRTFWDMARAERQGLDWEDMGFPEWAGGRKAVFPCTCLAPVDCRRVWAAWSRLKAKDSSMAVARVCPLSNRPRVHLLCSVSSGTQAMKLHTTQATRSHGFRDSWTPQDHHQEHVVSVSCDQGRVLASSVRNCPAFHGLALTKCALCSCAAVAFVFLLQSSSLRAMFTLDAQDQSARRDTALLHA